MREELRACGLNDAVVAPVPGDRLRGTVVVGSQHGRLPTLQQRRPAAARALGVQAGVALRRAEMFDRLRQEASARAHDASHDALTGLPNRALFRDARSTRSRTRSSPVGRSPCMLMDLDRFKEVNDTLGHHTGDLLPAAGRRSGCGRRPRAARGLVARLAADEFGMLLPRPRCPVTPALLVR